jgi:5-(carboxyamino)imidazole ribonucleotide mutase
VATVAINNAKNAGLLAAQIVAVKLPEVRIRLKAYKASMEQTVLDKAQVLEKIGYADFLAQSN